MGKVDSPHNHMRTVGPGRAQQEIPFVMFLLLKIYDLIFGCRHAKLSRVFTIEGKTYRVCLQCGTKLRFSLETMSLERSEQGGAHEDLDVVHSLNCGHALGGN
jgi:uncharacterized UBP type Zn finger protein